MQSLEKGTFKKSNTQIQVYEAIEDLQDNQNKITQGRIAEYLTIDVKTVKCNWLPVFKELVKTYNNDLQSTLKNTHTNSPAISEVIQMKNLVVLLIYYHHSHQMLIIITICWS